MSAFAGGDAGDKLAAVIEGELCVAAAEAAGDALHEDLGVFVNEDGHDSVVFGIGENSAFQLVGDFSGNDVCKMRVGFEQPGNIEKVFLALATPAIRGGVGSDFPC